MQRTNEVGSLSEAAADRKSTRLNSSHDQISYAVFCLKKKKNRPRLRLNLLDPGLDACQFLLGGNGEDDAKHHAARAVHTLAVRGAHRSARPPRASDMA